MRILPIIACLGLVACGPGLDDLPNIADVTVDPDATPVEALPSGDDIASDESVLERIVSDVTQSQGTQDEPVEVASNAARSPFGFLRRIRGGPTGPTVAEDSPPDSGPIDTRPTDTAEDADPSATPEGEVIPARAQAPEPTNRGGLGGLFRAALPQGGARERADDTPEVALGTLLPYGALARVCDFRRADLGTEVARYPERGNGYRLYDTNPSSTGLRTHYLVGFNDKCARQFTAALAIFGSSETHEAVRYDRSNRDLPYTDTDNAYETLKSRVCRVSANTPCPEGRREALDRDTIFVSVYERFLGNPRWADMLVHDGQVLAKDLKER